MADMFGAAAGISQAHADQRMQALAQMQELELQGKVAMQPTQKAFMESQTRENVAQAAKYEADASQTLGIGNIAKEFFNPNEAMGRMGGAQGRPAPGQPGGASPRVMQRSPGQLMVDFGSKVSQVYPTAGIGILEKATSILAHEASADNSRAEAEKRKLEGLGLRHKAVASLAGSVYDQPSYDKARAAAVGYGEDISKLPQTFNEFIATDPKTGMSMQRSYVMQGMTGMEQVKNQLEQLEAKRKADAAPGTEALKTAKAKSFIASAALATQLYEFRKKNDGVDSPSTVESKRAMIEKNERANIAKYEKEYSVIPMTKTFTGESVVDKKALVTGRKYRTADGRHGRWDGTSMQPLQVTPPTMQTRAQQGAQARTEALAAEPAYQVDTSIDEED